jgi:hypothetical protein
MSFRASCRPYLPKALPRELPVSQLTSGGSSTVRSMDVEIKGTHNLCNRTSWQKNMLDQNECCFFLICLLNDHCHSKIAVTAVTGPPLETHGDSPKMNAETWQGSPTVRGWLDSCQYAHAVVMCPLLNVSFSSILPTCFLAQVCVCVWYLVCLASLIKYPVLRIFPRYMFKNGVVPPKWQAR